MSPLTVISGPATVIASGSATCFGGCGLAMRQLVDGEPFDLELLFTSDPEVEDVAVHPESLDHGLRLHCVNFDDATGRGSAVPVALGALGEDEVVFVHFRVFRYGRTDDRTVHYTFYRAPRAVLGGA